MTVFRTLALCSASAVALSACGGGSSGTASKNATVFSAIEAGSVARALDDGKTLAATQNAVTRIDWNTGETSAASGDFSIRKTESGQLAFTVDGREHVFTEADYDAPFGYRIEDGDNSYWVSLYSFDGEMSEDLDPSDGGYVQVYQWYADVGGDGIAFDGMSVVGTRTEAAQLDLLTSAEYGGWMNADFAPVTGYDGGDSEVRVRGDMALSADFTGGSISGGTVPGELRLRDRGADEVFVDGVLTLNATSIDGTTFAGSIGVDSDFVANVGVGDVSGAYEGSFYGPFADEAAGTMTGTGSGGFNMIGQFNADKRN